VTASTTAPCAPVTLDTSYNTHVDYSGGNLKATTNAGTSGDRGVIPTESKVTGKWYWEIAYTKESVWCGVAQIGVADPAGACGELWNTGARFKYVGYGGASFCDEIAFTCGDTLGFAWDVDNHLLWIAKNGVWSSGDPGAGTGSCDIGTTYAWIPRSAIGPSFAGNQVSQTWNFGGSAFTYTKPSGFDDYDEC